MRPTFDAVAGAAVIAFFLYLRFRNYERHQKDLGDGGIQTLLGKKPPREDGGEEHDNSQVS